MSLADSAGVPWEGRSFHQNPLAGDDGSAPPLLLAALRGFRAGELGEAEVLDAARDVRLLVPLIAVRGDEGVGAHGQLVDKTQELSIVTVAGPDGRTVLPAFTSVEALAHWNPEARPIPIDSRRVALAAASEQTDLVVLDPTSDTEFTLRRPAVKALAVGEPWRPAYADPEVLAAVEASTRGDDRIRGVRLLSGDPHARLAGPEIIVELALVPGLDQDAVDAVVRRVGEAWSVDDLIAERVDSIAISLVAG